MSYYDRWTPRIVIHEDVEAQRVRRPCRHPVASFPEAIQGSIVDPHLLGLIESGYDATDTFRQFLYSYQILEYVAFYFVDEQAREVVRRTLASPDVGSRAAECADEIIDALAESRRSDEARINAVVGKLANPKAVWKDIEANQEYFAGHVKFDGGFELPPLIKEGWGADDFEAAWIPKVPDTLRRLRNALVHARESRMVGVIAPTTANHNRLAPWLGPIRSVAMDACLYRRPLL